MKQNFLKWSGVWIASVLAVSAVSAQETNDVEQLRKELREMRERMLSLEQKLGSIEQKSAATVEVIPEVAPVAASNWKPTDPARVSKGGSYMDISLDGLFAAGGSTASDIEGGTQLGGHDPNQRGFTVQNVELTLSGAVDPYFRGQANVVLQIDSVGESFLELEEMYAETTSLPGNLQLKAGQYFTEFGRLNPQHPHSWAFADQPLVNGRLLGLDGMRNVGTRLSWLAPTPFYSELFFGVQNSQGGTAASFRSDHGGAGYLGRIHDASRVKSGGDMLYSARYVASFDVTDTQTLLAGASAAFGPNGSGADTDTQIYGVDLYWKWKPENAHAGFPFVSWQTEAMLRKYQAGVSTTVDLTGDTVADFVPRETVTDWGAYSQLLWGFKSGWVAGLRGDFVTGDKAAYEKLYGDDLSRATRWRISPNLTWYPTEFSKIRLQYNYDDRDGIGEGHSVWLQFEFFMGAHAAHKF